jgi:hypothetical protein
MKRTVSSRRRLPTTPPGPRTRRKRVHGHLISLFAVAAALLVVLNIAVVLTPTHSVLATSAENVTGWGWSSTGGWLSMNDTNSGSGGGSYGVNIDGSKNVTGFAWSPNQGWVCFGSSCTVASCANGANTPAGASPTASLDGSNNLRGWGMICNLGAPNGWISLNCNDTSPVSCGTSTYGPLANLGTGTFSGYAWHGLSGSAGWGWIDFSQVTLSAGTENVCNDGLDNDLDGATDCSDSNCSASPSCIVETGAALCTNSIDDDLDGATDCSDAGCLSVDACTPPWLQAQYGNIYGQQGVSGNAAPTSTGKTNATFCISSAGTISNFTSENSCLEPSASPLTLPISTNGYVSNIGKVDVAGIVAGRYGVVTSIATDASLPTSLNGGIYLYDRDAQGGTCPSSGPNGASTAFQVNAKTFNNATQATGRGNGLLIVKGCDIVIAGNLAYQAAGVSTYLRNLASIGVIDLSKYVSGVPTYGGNIYINSGVTSIVGLYFAERSIHTGSTGGTFTDVQLNVSGALVSHDIKLERRYGSQSAAAENITFDARSIVNPPPGMQDVTKSLPTVRDTY